MAEQQAKPVEASGGIGKQPIIVIKRVKKGGHGGHHGGAWKVAYADFVTAMMCFFLVMWLMGSDEETKAIVASYFNNTSLTPLAWRPDLNSKDTVPLGNMTGAGESLLKGAQGKVPEDLVQRPAIPQAVPVAPMEKARDPSSLVLDNLLADEDLMALDLVKFSIPESELFEAGKADKFLPSAEKWLTKLGKITTGYNQGSLAVLASHDGAFELANARASALVKYIVDKNWFDESHVSTRITPAKAVAADTEAPSRRIEFVLTKPD